MAKENERTVTVMAEYIEREAAYEDFEKCNSENPKWTPSRVKALIARQKSADVASVRHGRWLTQVVLGQKAWDCSECKTLGSPCWKWCPVCGAIMDG